MRLGGLRRSPERWCPLPNPNFSFSVFPLFSVLTNDLRVPLKAGVLVHGQTGSFDITTKCGTGSQHTSVGSENVAIDCSMHNHRGRADLGPDLSVLTDCQYTGRVDSALHFAVNHQLTPESHIAFNRYSFGKHTFGSLSSCSK